MLQEAKNSRAHINLVCVCVVCRRDQPRRREERRAGTAMAVEAFQLHHLLPTREVAGAVDMGAFLPAAPCCEPAAWSESGITSGAAPPRKRARVEADPGEAGVAAHLQQQLLDVDRLVLHHAEKLRAGLAERRRRYARQVMAALEQAVARRLRAKDEEIERIGKLNWALEERVRSLYAEAQIWRDLAQSNEAAANALRTNLEQVLDAQAHAADNCDAGDAESCCCGENAVADAGEEEEGAGRGCWCCGAGAAEVLMLPCRHLCACAPCAAAACACPVCGSAKNAFVCVNLS